MAVRANDLALLDLVKDALPAAVAEPLPDREGLFADVIELEHQGVVFAAVDARVPSKELH
jgi:hypothetical protein